MSVQVWFEKRELVFAIIGCILFFSLLVITSLLFSLLMINSLTHKIERWTSCIRLRLEDKVKMPYNACPTSVPVNWLMDPREIDVTLSKEPSVNCQSPWRAVRPN